ncbi:MAG: bestrophin family ion channel [Agriterribacter sp.]
MLLKGKIPIGYILHKIKFEIIFICAYTILVWFITEHYNLKHISIPLGIPTILGTIISLLLAFRSNQAYDRWWEARIIWGAIVNDSRTFARQLLCFVHTPYDNDERSAFQRRIINRQVAWCYSLGQSLRNLNPLEGLERLVSKKELNFVSTHDSIPYALINLHAKDIKMAVEEGWINEFQQVELDRTLTRLCDSMGKCERIKNTIFPTTYSLYIHFALYFFILLLPFGVIEYVGLVEIPLVTILASFFLLIERMAVHLQDPFENKPTDTPMFSIARNIERNLLQILQGENIPAKAPSKGYYIL